MSEEEGWRNDVAVNTGNRITSAYETARGVTILVIIEGDRTATTIMLPSEN